MTEEQPWVVEFQNYNGEWKHIGWYSSSHGCVGEDGEYTPRFVTMEKAIEALKTRSGKSRYPWRMRNVTTGESIPAELFG